MLAEVAAESPGDARPRAERIECQRQLGWVLSIQGRRKDAETVHREALADTELLAAEFPELPFYKHEIAHCCINLAATVSLSRPHESAELCRRAIQMAEGVPVNRYCLSQAHRMQGELLLRSNRHRAAEAEFRKALVVYDQMLRDEGDDWNRKLPKALILKCLASALSATGQFAQAERSYREAIAIVEKFAADSPRVPYYTDTMAAWRMGLAGVLRSAKRFDEAEVECRAVVALLDSLTGEYPNTLDLRDKLPVGGEYLDIFLVATREPTEPAYRRADPIPRRQTESEGSNLTHHARRAQAYQELGGLLVAVGRPAEAEVAFRTALDVFQKLEANLAAKPEHQVSLAHTLALGALWLQNAGRYADAAEVSRRALGQFSRLAAKEPTNRMYLEWLAGEHFRLGSIHSLANQPAEAEKLYGKAAEDYAKLAGEGADRHDFLFAQASTQHNLGIQRLCLKRPNDAASRFRKSLELYGQLPPEFREKPGYRRNVAVTSNNLAWLLVTATDAKVRKVADAVAAAKVAVELAPSAGHYWNTLGVAQYRAGEWQAASLAIERSMTLRDGGDSYDWFIMAMIRQKTNENAKAREWFDKADAWAEKNDPKNEELRRFRAEAEEELGIEKKGK
jgi:tetratricopeptide (TPR) repeat protein